MDLKRVFASHPNLLQLVELLEQKRIEVPEYVPGSRTPILIKPNGDPSDTAFTLVFIRIEDRSRIILLQNELCIIGASYERYTRNELLELDHWAGEITPYLREWYARYDSVIAEHLNSRNRLN